mgnify:FL=1
MNRKDRLFTEGYEARESARKGERTILKHVIGPCLTDDDYMMWSEGWDVRHREIIDGPGPGDRVEVFWGPGGLTGTIPHPEDFVGLEPEGAYILEDYGTPSNE